MKTIKHLIYCTTCILFITIIGAGIYEHAAVWPYAWAAPPASLSMFQGDYGLNSQAFWPRIHPPTFLLMLLSTILFWKTERRNYLLITLTGYLAVMIWTFIYFVPELISISGTDFSNTIDEALVARASKWESLSLIRLAVIIAIAFLLLTGLSKHTESKRKGA